MSSPYRVAVLVGSLRKASFNRKLALALANLAPSELKLEIVEIGALQRHATDASKTVDRDSNHSVLPSSMY